MKRHTIALTLGFTLLASGALAQEPIGGGDRPRGDRPPPARGDFRPPVHPLMGAIDTDKDGTLSESEIKNATAALRKLDKNKDGKLDRTELRPAGLRGGPRGPGDRGGAGGPRGSGRGPGGGQGGFTFADRIMSFDANKDGKVTKAEMPERMQRILTNGDTNNDGAISRAEADKLAASFRNRGGGRGGAGNGDRPNRPNRPE